jgi:methyl-accepting chemotaxis protein
MPRLANFSIPVRIAVAILLPLLAFTGFAGKDLLDKRSEYSKIEQIADLAEATPTITNFIHELQKERGSSGGLLNNDLLMKAGEADAARGQTFVTALRDQRPVVDKARAEWEQRMGEFQRQHAGSKFARDIEAARSKLAELPAMRAKIDALSVKPQESIDYYQPIISLLAAAVDEISELTDDARIARRSIALGSHVRRKEWAALERSNGVTAIGNREFTPASFFQMIRSRTIQDSQAANFRRYATQDQVDYVDNALKGPVTDDLTRMRTAFYEVPFKGSMKDMKVAQWLQATARYIDVLKAAEDKLSGEFIAAVRVIKSETRWGFWSVLALFVVMLAVTCLLSIVVMLSITRPIAQLVGTMGELALGHNDINVPGADRGDELGRMAKAVLVFRDAGREKVRIEAQAEEQRKTADEERRKNAEAQAKSAAEQAEAVKALAGGLAKLSEGDLRVRLNEGFTETYKQIRDDFNTTIGRLQETIGSIVSSTREVASTAAEISSSTTDLSQRTEEQAASLEETSASMEEISTTVKKNAENAQQANAFANSTREVADRGGAVVAQAVSAMSRIEESSRKISDIISVIDEIARQTNLLALNAAVEAARAGEAGRGFAVVASEVRSLAQRSSQAAKDIKDLITNSSGQVQEGVELVNKAGASLTEIVESIKKVAEIVSEIASASGEQSTGIDQVTTALNQMDEVTQQNSALVEENAAAAKALEQQSQGMDERVSFFQIDTAATAKQPHAAVPAPHRTDAVAAKRADAPAPRRAAAAAAVRRPGGGARTQAALAIKDDPDWQEF